MNKICPFCNEEYDEIKKWSLNRDYINTHIPNSQVHILIKDRSIFLYIHKYSKF